MPEDVPLRIPELRSGRKDVKHEHRLDFTVIDPYTLSKASFELPLWSMHGLLSGTKGKTKKAIDEEAQANFVREMLKLKAYFGKRGIPVIVYTDKDIQDHARIFTDIENYLTPAKLPKQLEFHALEDFLAFKSPKLFQAEAASGNAQFAWPTQCHCIPSSRFAIPCPVAYAMLRGANSA